MRQRPSRLLGGVFTIVLVKRRVTEAIVIAIGVITLIGIAVPAGGGKMVTQLPENIFSASASPAPVLFKLTLVDASPGPRAIASTIRPGGTALICR